MPIPGGSRRSRPRPPAGRRSTRSPSCVTSTSPTARTTTAASARCSPGTTSSSSTASTSSPTPPCSTPACRSRPPSSTRSCCRRAARRRPACRRSDRSTASRGGCSIGCWPGRPSGRRDPVARRERAARAAAVPGTLAAPPSPRLLAGDHPRPARPPGRHARHRRLARRRAGPAAVARGRGVPRRGLGPDRHRLRLDGRRQRGRRRRRGARDPRERAPGRRPGRRCRGRRLAQPPAHRGRRPSGALPARRARRPSRRLGHDARGLRRRACRRSSSRTSATSRTGPIGFNGWASPRSPSRSAGCAPSAWPMRPSPPRRIGP